MKSIIIHINRLGAVINSTIELKPLLIFSGESGLGKSYVAIGAAGNAVDISLSANYCIGYSTHCSYLCPRPC